MRWQNTLKIQSAIPQTFFDFQSENKIRKRGYNYEIFEIDKSVIRRFKNALVPATVQSDHGLVYEKYKEDFTDYNTGIESTDQVIRSDDEDLFFQYTVYLAYNSDIYFRQNQRMNEVVGNIGGIINILFVIPRLIGFVYNYFYLRFFLVTNTFTTVRSDYQKDNFHKQQRLKHLIN